MSLVFGKQSPANKVVPVKGQTLAQVIGTASLDDVGLYNWGTKDKHEINRALVEAIGCETVDDADPTKSVFDPALGPGGAIYVPKLWQAEDGLELGKTHTIKLKKRLPVTSVAISELTSWFEPNTATKCSIKYRLDGVAARADQTDLEVHVASFRELEKGVLKTRSTYYEIKKTARDTDKPIGPDNPEERNQVPCGTDGDADTYVRCDHQDAVAPAPLVSVTWDGKCDAKRGVLKDPAFINSSCAPYTILVRYYKDGADKKARLRFKESFYPRWKLSAGPTWTLIPASLVVHWEIDGDNGKLKAGRLVVFDKDGKVAVQVGLDADTLQRGVCDLAPLWPAVQVDRAKMPYRAQLQAHSDAEEANGLAVAIMPTQVRAYDYKKVQLVAFNIRPGGTYIGNADDATDITARCAAMVDAVQTAYASTVTATDTLKIFMAPEFYFRGLHGAYPVEMIETIMPQLREESDKIRYADWMFVFGSAIGYEKHDEGGTPIVHGEALHRVKLTAVTPTQVTAKVTTVPEVGWAMISGAASATITRVVPVIADKVYDLSFVIGPVFVPGEAFTLQPKAKILERTPSTGKATRLRVDTSIAARIPATTVGGQHWKAIQEASDCEITGVTHVVDDEYWLDLKPPGDNFASNQAFQLIEPVSTEVINAALVQKGYPIPHLGDKSLRDATIYKEKISPIDFAHNAADWHAVDGAQRKIIVHGTANRPVLPTQGSDDLVGASPNVTRKPMSNVGSEINQQGLGGGVVLTMDDVTFGIEVCLDHAKNRLAKFYGATGNKRTGDPKPQVHLIPSYGMSIGAGEICCPPVHGIVFNVDGQDCKSVARLYDGTTYSCDDHWAETGALWTVCTKDVKYYWCWKCGVHVRSGGNCDVHPGVVRVEQWRCGAAKFYDCGGGACFGLTVPCGHVGVTGLFQCKSCETWIRNGYMCACAPPKPVSALCGRYYNVAGGVCPDGHATNHRCNRLMQNIGAGIAPQGAGLPVNQSRGVYFQRAGRVFTYPVQDLADPDFV